MEQQFLNLEFMGGVIIEIIKFIPVTLKITAVSMLFALIIALTVAIIRIYKLPVLKELAVFYVSFIRGTPLLVQIYLSYYGFPKIFDYINLKYGYNIDISMVPAIIFVYVAFSLNVGAYLSETFRASILSVDKGQSGNDKVTNFKKNYSTSSLCNCYSKYWKYCNQSSKR